MTRTPGVRLLMAAALFAVAGLVACNGVDPLPTPTATPSEPSAACEVGMTLSAGQSCSYEGGGSFFTLDIREDNYACVGGICGGSSLNINNLSVVRDGAAWVIEGLP